MAKGKAAITLDEYMRETKRRDEKIAELTKALETGFMQGAYARLHELQQIEQKYYAAQNVLSLCKDWYRNASQKTMNDLWYQIGLLIEKGEA